MAAKTDPQADPGTGPAGTTEPGTEEGRITSLDDRFGRIEAKQAEQDGVLNKLLEHVQGGGRGDGQGEPAGQQVTYADFAGQVQAEIKAAEERRAAEDKAKGDADWRTGVDDAIEKLKTENTPREPQTGAKGRLQRLMFGRPD